MKTLPLLEHLVARRAVHQRVAMVVAHPDDETLAAGARLEMLPHLLLVHVTDGAPRRLSDPADLGFDTPEAYAEAREAELQAALVLAGADPQRLRLGVPDQDASLRMPDIADRLARAFDDFGAEILLTHTYEGGHPDHDATACAVHRAAAGRPIIEFAGYHAGPDGEMTVQRFLPGLPVVVKSGFHSSEIRVGLDPEEQSRKRAMLDCFVTQSAILSHFGVSVERYRAAPAYDFTAPPHSGQLNYERWGWDMTGARWRSLAGQCPCVA